MDTVHIFSKKTRILDKLSNALKEQYNIKTFQDLGRFVDDAESADCIILDESSIDEADLDMSLDLEKVKLFILSDIPTIEDGEKLLAAGITGYGNVNMNEIHLRQALSVILSGNVWVYPLLMKYIIKKATEGKKENSEALEKLTKREKEISELVADGLGNIEIADRLNISERTVKLHLNSIYQKLDIHSRLKLALAVKNI